MNAEATAPMGWNRYKPSGESPWNVRRIVHLYRRAGFGATVGQVARAQQIGFEKTLDAILAGSVHDDARQRPSDEETPDIAKLLTESAINSNHIGRLKSAWITRMLCTGDPLAEQLTLMWHDHFATSYLKVNDVRMMWDQNELFRRRARGPFAELLGDVLKDPAMLIWLDANSNSKKLPNENLARELMELFTLGVGHYSESDVKEAARALTGLTVVDGAARTDPHKHDGGVKTVLGKTGRISSGDLVKLLVTHPATCSRIAGRICDHFLGEGVASNEQMELLAMGLGQNRLSIDWAIRTALSSQLFFSATTIGRRITPPVVFVTGAVRALDSRQRRPPAAVLADWMAELGQDLFHPPNVGGWPGGRAWMSSQRMIARIRFANMLGEQKAKIPSPANTRMKSKDDLTGLLLGRPLGSEVDALLVESGAEQAIISTVLSLAEAQVD